MLDKTFQSSAGPLKYLLFVPKDYSANRRYPLVVSLRGSGSTYMSATDGFEAAHPWIQDSVQARVPHFIMVPECNSGTWGGLAGAASNGVMATASKIVIEAIEDLKKQYSLDSNRFVLTGFSLGGSGTYHILELMPDYWAAGVPTAAGGDTSRMTYIAKTPTWHHQGANDGNAGRRMTKALEERGHKVVRMVCDFTIDSPAKWRSAIQGGAKPEDIIFRNARAPVTVDSLRRAIEAGATYIYSELTGGNHSSAWMNAAHNPLLAKWAFSKVRGGGTVSLAPMARRTRMEQSGAILTYGNPGAAGGRMFSLLGRRVMEGRRERLPAATAGVAIRPIPE
jgi:poly(3-hydroxybutyrate) depolymerase